MDDRQRNLEQEEMLGEIIREGPLLVGDIVREGGDVFQFLNDTDGLEEEGEAGSGDRTMEVEGHAYDGSCERTEEGVVGKSGEVYIIIKPVLTS
jgi:hypothetical protein